MGALELVEAQPTLNPALRKFWRERARNRVLIGGRASSKTWDAGGMAVFLAHNYKAKFLCTRQFQNRIDDSVYAVIKRQIDRFGLNKHFNIGKTTIECPATGSEFLFYGRARNIEEIKGTEGVDIHWGEECELLTKEQWKIINGTIREEGSQHWIIFNPQFATDFAYQRFVVSPPADTVVRLINYPENPFLSKTMRDVIADCLREDPDEHAHVYLGVPLTDSDRVIIRSTWIEAAVDAHIKLGFKAEGDRRVGFDVADSGNDKCASITAHGSVAVDSDEWKAGEDELLKSCSMVYNKAVEFGDANIIYDSIGVGAHCGAKINELNESRSKNIEHFGFNAGGGVVNPDREYMPGRTNADQFANIKAQAWWMVADRFRNTYNAVTKGEKFPVDQLISISSSLPHLTKLKTELATPFRDFDQNGRTKVESKKDLKTRHIESHNLADAFVMDFAPVEFEAKSFFENFMSRS